MESWNTGNITSIWKGKGDRESLHNQRGITTSSAIGTIVDTLIDNRIESIVPFTNAQGGGQKGMTTCDHLFIIRTIMEISKKQKRDTYLTFYDVKKAYDNVDNDDMLCVMWDKGLKGKTWRILHNLNKNLNAKVKTRYGLTRTVTMEIGGKQGSRLTGRMFSKLMDMLAEELEPTSVGFPISDDLKVATLLWVDDVVTAVQGTQDQEIILQHVNNFAIRHKLTWGIDKCKIMRVGEHKQGTKKWHLGDVEIEETGDYKYLGDTITNDGKNIKNIETRKNKVFTITVGINAIAGTDVLRRIETPVLLELHEKMIIPALLANAETWVLNKSECTELERIETQTLKHLFDLPVHTPTPAIIFTLGTMYTKIRIDIKKFTYLHRLLTSNDSSWAKKALRHLLNLDLGWGKNIKESLMEYNLPIDLSSIQSMTTRQWKNAVKERAEIANKRKLIDDCHKKENDISVPKTKTAHIIEKIQNDTYVRTLRPEYKTLTKNETKALIISRFKMLECGRNFKGSMNEICRECNCTDDENHRMNYCIKYKSNNFYDSDDKVDLNDIFSTDADVLRNIIAKINLVWNVKTAHGSMNN